MFISFHHTDIIPQFWIKVMEWCAMNFQSNLEKNILWWELRLPFYSVNRTCMIKAYSFKNNFVHKSSKTLHGLVFQQLLHKSSSYFGRSIQFSRCVITAPVWFSPCSFSGPSAYSHHHYVISFLWNILCSQHKSTFEEKDSQIQMDVYCLWNHLLITIIFWYWHKFFLGWLNSCRCQTFLTKINSRHQFFIGINQAEEANPKESWKATARKSKLSYIRNFNISTLARFILFDTFL